MTTEINPSSIETERKNAKQKRNLLIVVLLCSNIITLAGLMLLSFHFSVPSKVLKRIENGQLFFPASKHKYADNKKKRNNDYEIYKSLFRVYKPKNINIVMMGNSITRGADWNELLSRTDVANRSIDGDTTEGIKNRLDDIYILKPKVCFVMTGHNDLTKGVEPEKIFEDYKIIIDGLLAHSIIPVIQSTLDMSKKRAKYKNYRLENEKVKYNAQKLCE